MERERERERVNYLLNQRVKYNEFVCVSRAHRKSPMKGKRKKKKREEREKGKENG